jgi:alpha-L-rhamnosidase
MINKPFDLRCEHQKDPLGIDNLLPRFSWKYQSDKINSKQYFYQIIIASSIEKANQEIGDFYCSDKIESNQSSLITLPLPKLKSRKKYFWKVRLWNQNNQQSLFSNTSSFEMGLLSKLDWHGKWIRPAQHLHPVGAPEQCGVYIRKEFSIKKQIEYSRIYIACEGLYEITLNGKKVGDSVLDPAWINAEKSFTILNIFFFKNLFIYFMEMYFNF